MGATSCHQRKELGSSNAIQEREMQGQQCEHEDSYLELLSVHGLKVSKNFIILKEGKYASRVSPGI